MLLRANYKVKLESFNTQFVIDVLFTLLQLVDYSLSVLVHVSAPALKFLFGRTCGSILQLSDLKLTLKAELK